MDWTQVLTILGGNIALFMWATRQARSDYLHMDRKLEENRKETAHIAMETQQLVREIKEEATFFHARICAIEERKK